MLMTTVENFNEKISLQNDEHDDNIDLDRVDLKSMGANSGSSVDTGAIQCDDNF